MIAMITASIRFMMILCAMQPPVSVSMTPAVYRANRQSRVFFPALYKIAYDASLPSVAWRAVSMLVPKNFSPELKYFVRFKTLQREKNGINVPEHCTHWNFEEVPASPSTTRSVSPKASTPFGRKSSHEKPTEPTEEAYDCSSESFKHSPLL